jgi:hypothetical protein
MGSDIPHQSCGNRTSLQRHNGWLIGPIPHLSLAPSRSEGADRQRFRANQHAVGSALSRAARCPAVSAMNWIDDRGLPHWVEREAGGWRKRRALTCEGLRIRCLRCAAEFDKAAGRGLQSIVSRASPNFSHELGRARDASAPATAQRVEGFRSRRSP